MSEAFEQAVQDTVLHALHHWRDNGLHIHVHHHVEGAPDAHAVLHAIRDLKETIMTELNTAALRETSDSAKLVEALNHLGDALEQLRSNNNGALKQALADAGADAQATTNILNANDGAIDAALSRANTILASAQGDTTTAGGGTDTVAGGNASDTVVAGGGTDTTVGASATNTGVVMPGSESVVGGGGTDSIQVGGNPGAEGQAQQDAQVAGTNAVGGAHPAEVAPGAAETVITAADIASGDVGQPAPTAPTPPGAFS